MLVLTNPNSAISASFDLNFDFLCGITSSWCHATGTSAWSHSLSGRSDLSGLAFIVGVCSEHGDALKITLIFISFSF